MPILLKKIIFILIILVLQPVISLATAGKASAQAADSVERVDTTIHYDQINVTILIEGLGSYNMDVIYTDHALLYVHVEELLITKRIHYRCM